MKPAIVSPMNATTVPEFRLWFLIPSRHPQLFRAFFIAELALIPFNVVIWIIGIRVAYKVRLHINLRLITLSFMVYYYLVLACRAIALLFQLDVFVYDGKPEDNYVIMSCSLLRSHFFATILTGFVQEDITVAHSVSWRDPTGVCNVFSERLAATYFIADYERKSRLWIPVFLITSNYITSAIASYFWTYQVIPWWYLASLGVGSCLTGAVGFVLLFRHNNTRLTVINKDHRLARLPYTLSLRFQLDENIRSTKQLKTGFLVLGIQCLFYATIYVIGHVDVLRSIEDGWISQFLDTLFHFLIATGGVIIALAVFLTDSNIVVLVKSLKYIGWLVPAPHLRLLQQTAPIKKDAGHLYFVSLENQWESRFEQDQKSYRPRTRSRRRNTVRTGSEGERTT